MSNLCYAIQIAHIAARMRGTGVFKALRAAFQSAFPPSYALRKHFIE
jgi:hypothetical protein